ncbi:MAG TPA: GPW/gp25 family protein [Roseiflexaceae bacterium]|nr:GPW/gp25 family protein [Roseiflexaceae bacterium]
MRERYDLIGKGWRFPLDVDGRGGIALTGGQDEIEEAIQIIITTPLNTRIMRPTFGCRIHELLFAPLNSSTTTAAVHYVREALEMWEPRITIKDVIAERDPDQHNCLLIYLTYQEKATHDERALVYPFYTIPDER